MHYWFIHIIFVLNHALSLLDNIIAKAIVTNEQVWREPISVVFLDVVCKYVEQNITFCTLEALIVKNVECRHAMTSNTSFTVCFIRE